MKRTRQNLMHTLARFGLTAMLAVSAACVPGMEAPVTEGPSGVDPAVVLSVPDALTGQYDAQAEDDFLRLREELTQMSRTLSLDADEQAKIQVTYLGRGEVVDEALRDVPSDRASQPASSAVEPVLEDEPGYASWDTFSLRSKNQFRVRLPSKVLDAADARATREGLNLGSGTAEERLEFEGLPVGAEAPAAPVEELVLDDGTVVQAGWSNGQDTRSLRGTYNTAQTNSAWRKLVDIGGCSGTMIGPKHIITAAHCIRDFDDSRWVSSTARAGRSGNAWRDSVSFSTSDTWYWTPSQFRSIADGEDDMPFSATPYDIGVIVTHGDRMGNTVGWMGWYWWSSDSAFGNRVRYNRGYPLCGRDNSPANCQTNGLYGDSAYCAVGDYSAQDSDGINRRFRFHCDVSGGHSGSSLYHYLNGDTLVVTSVVSWEHCRTCSASDDRPNTGVRITKSYSGTISWLRQTFP